MTEDASPERFRGLQILDISDLRRPVQVAAVLDLRRTHQTSPAQPHLKDLQVKRDALIRDRAPPLGLQQKIRQSLLTKHFEATDAQTQTLLDRKASLAR